MFSDGSVIFCTNIQKPRFPVDLIGSELPMHMSSVSILQAGDNFFAEASYF